MKKTIYILDEMDMCLKDGHNYITYNNSTKCTRCGHLENTYELKPMINKNNKENKNER